MIISLWKLPDESAAFLMREFYNHYLKSQDAALAQIKAQQITRTIFKEEESWAGLILIE